MFSSYMEGECSGPPQPDPGWVAVLLAYERVEYVISHFEDASLEWGRGSHNPNLYGGSRNIGNKMMPLGYMLRIHAYRLAGAFLEKFGNVHDTCAWYNCEPFTPLQYVTKHRNVWNINVWFPLLWENGVTVAELESEALLFEGIIGREGSLGRAYISLYKERESAMLALAWTCDQIAGTSWADCTELVVKRMRRTKEN